MTKLSNTEAELKKALLIKKVVDSLEALVLRCSVKKMFLEISQNSQENTCARVFFLIKLQGSRLQLY